MPTIRQLLTALGITIVFFGSTHLMVAYFLMVTRDINEGNLFRILNFNKLFPGIDIGWENFILSNILALSLFTAWVIYFVRKDKKTQARDSKDRILE